MISHHLRNWKNLGTNEQLPKTERTPKAIWTVRSNDSKHSPGTGKLEVVGVQPRLLTEMASAVLGAMKGPESPDQVTNTKLCGLARPCGTRPKMVKADTKSQVSVHDGQCDDAACRNAVTHWHVCCCVGVGCVPRYRVVVRCPVIPARGGKHAHLMNGSTTYYSSTISQKPGQSFLVTSSVTARDDEANDGITGTFGFSALWSRSHHGPIFHYDEDDYYHPSPSLSTSRARSD